MKNTNSFTIASIVASALLISILILSSSCSTSGDKNRTDNDMLHHDTVYVEKEIAAAPPPAPKPREKSRAEQFYLITDSAQYLYDLYHYDQKFRLPYVLETVSGLVYTEPNVLGMVEDEGGKVYEYNIKTKKVIHSIAFTAPGDFEGVAVYKNYYYAVKSNGDLYKIPRSKKKKVKSKLIKTPLSARNNIEGLTCDSKKDRLLLVTKQSGDTKKRKVKGKAVFAYDLKKDKFKSKPVLEINHDRLYEFFITNRDLVYDESKIKIKPSGIAIHPLNNHYYILASTGKIMVEMDRKGQIVATYPISPKLLIQPEGICFDEQGDLYISSEGQGERGYILKFKMKHR